MLNLFKSYLNQGYDTILLREWQQAINRVGEVFPENNETAELFTDLFWLFLVVADWESCDKVNEWLISYGERHDLQWKIDGMINNTFKNHYCHDHSNVEDNFKIIESLMREHGSPLHEIKFYFLKMMFFLEQQEISRASDMIVHMSDLLREFPLEEGTTWFNLAQVKVATHSGNLAEALSLFNAFHPTIEKNPQDWHKFFWHETWLQLLLMMRNREAEVMAHATEYLRLAEVKDYKLEAKICYESLLQAKLRLKNFKDIQRLREEYNRIILSSGCPEGWLMDEKFFDVILQLATRHAADASPSPIPTCKEVISLARKLNNENYLLKAYSMLSGVYLYRHNNLEKSLEVLASLKAVKPQWTSKPFHYKLLFSLANLHLLKMNLHEAMGLLLDVVKISSPLRQHDIVFRSFSLMCLINWFQKDYSSFQKNMEMLMDLDHRITDLTLKSWSWSVLTYVLSAIKRMKDAEKPTRDLEMMVRSLKPGISELSEEEMELVKRNSWLAKGTWYLNQMDFDNLDLILKNMINPWLQSLDAILIARNVRHWFLFKLLSVRRDLTRSLMVSSLDLQPSILERLLNLQKHPLVSDKEVLLLMIDATVALIYLFNGNFDNYLQLHRQVIEKATRIPVIVAEDRLAELLLAPSKYDDPPRENEEKMAIMRKIDQYLELLYAVGEIIFSADELLRRTLFPSYLSHDIILAGTKWSG